MRKLFNQALIVVAAGMACLAFAIAGHAPPAACPASPAAPRLSIGGAPVCVLALVISEADEIDDKP